MTVNEPDAADRRIRPPRPVLPDMAAAHRRGPADAVEAQWQTLPLAWQWRHDHRPGTAMRGLLGLLAAAGAEPRLRRLYPFTSHYTLRFSSCTTHPWVLLMPSVEPLRTGRFRILAPRSTSAIGETDTAEEAIALVLDHAPVDIGPAIAGAAPDFRT